MLHSYWLLAIGYWPTRYGSHCEDAKRPKQSRRRPTETPDRHAALRAGRSR
jgi:hypothetical protein